MEFDYDSAMPERLLTVELNWLRRDFKYNNYRDIPQGGSTEKSFFTTKNTKRHEIGTKNGVSE